MFDNFATALVQAFGFGVILIFFVYQTIFADRKSSNTNSISSKETKNLKNIEKTSLKMSLFNRKKQTIQKDEKPKRNSRFNKNEEPIDQQIKLKKRRWFR